MIKRPAVPHDCSGHCSSSVIQSVAIPFTELRKILLAIVKIGLNLLFFVLRTRDEHPLQDRFLCNFLLVLPLLATPMPIRIFLDSYCAQCN
jgi:hypothetical protein